MSCNRYLIISPSILKTISRRFYENILDSRGRLLDFYFILSVKILRICMLLASASGLARGVKNTLHVIPDLLMF